MAPAGGHSSQAGALLDRAVVPVAEEMPDPVPVDGVLPPVPAAFDRPPPLEVDPVAEFPEVDPVAELPAVVPVAELPAVVPVVVAVAGPVCVALVAVAAVVVGNVTAPYGLARLVPAAAPVAAVVCAAAEDTTATNSGNTMINGLIIRLMTPPPGFPATSSFNTA